MFRTARRALAGVRRNMALARVFSNWRSFRSAERRSDGGETVLRTRSGLRLAVRHNKWDTKIVWEQFVARYYLVGVTLPMDRQPVVVDIGAYIGDFTLFCAHELKAYVIAYEPTIENFVILQKNLDLNPGLVNRVVAVNRGVASTNELTANVQVRGAEVHVSSTWYADDPLAERRSFACDTLAELLEKHSLESVDLLKIDCEGEEYNIILTAPNDLYDRIGALVYEWHRIPGYAPRLEALEQKLRSVGFLVARAGQLGYATRA